MDLGIIIKEFLEEYCIFIGKLIYGNVDAALLWLRLLAKYLVKKCNLKRSEADSFIFFRKYEKGKVEIRDVSPCDYVFMARKPETSKYIK